MFVERLTEEQVKDFLHQEYSVEYYQSFFRSYEEAIVGWICEWDGEVFDRPVLYDFEVLYSNMENIRNNWMKYLYKIFGEEYKEAYLAECAKIFE